MLGRPKVKKLRVALILAGLSALALISTIFGMLMAVAHELPSLEDNAQLRASVNSRLYADDGQQIAVLTDNRNRILDSDSEISPWIKRAVVAVEDKRFYHHTGVDLRGIARAVLEDVLQQHAAQGASTITEQFVKNALLAQKDRTVFEKMREAALAYHLEKRWSKQKILDQYLNTIYFGNGAYGVESAVRTYFGGQGRHYSPGEHIADQVTPDQAAMLAGMIASPGAYDPIQSPARARGRRDLVLRDMLGQHLLTRAQFATAVAQPIPTASQLNPPHADSDQPYFSSWLTQQLVDRYGSGRVFGGGMKVTTTIDPAFQSAAEQAIQGRLGGVGPSASLVAIDNRTGEVKAMVGGDDFERTPFNLATNGHRQPGSAMKAFVLATALEHGVSPWSEWSSRPKVFPIPGGGSFAVKNFGNEYAGTISLFDATATSDNSVYAELGLRLGTRAIAQTAEQMGIRTPVSTNPAMVLGGLHEGLTPLELAYAYSTIANGGRRVSGSFASSPMGPVALTKVQDGGHTEVNHTVSQQVLPPSVAAEMKFMLRGVVLYGTAQSAQVSEFAAGKTGTTTNYGDAWFVGFTPQYTVAVWVGYPNGFKPMLTEFHGQPVEGGSYPAQIWHDFITQTIAIDQQRHPGRPAPSAGPSVPAPAPVAPSAPVTPSAPAAPSTTTTTTPVQTAPAQTAPAQPAPQQAPPQRAPPQQSPPPQTPPQQAPPPSGGGGTGTGTGTGGRSGGAHGPGRG